MSNHSSNIGSSSSHHGVEASSSSSSKRRVSFSEADTVSQDHYVPNVSRTNNRAGVYHEIHDYHHAGANSCIISSTDYQTKNHGASSKQHYTNHAFQPRPHIDEEDHVFVPAKKKRYTTPVSSSISSFKNQVVVRSPHSYRQGEVTSGNTNEKQWHYHHRREYSGEGKENLPSPQSYSHDEYKNKNHYYTSHSSKLGPHAMSAYESVVPSSVYHPVDHHAAPPTQQVYYYPPDHHYYSYPNEAEWHSSSQPQGGYYHHSSRPPAPSLYPPRPPSDVSRVTSMEKSRPYEDYGSYTPIVKDTRNTGYSFVDHTYRDFSGVHPTDEDRERYNNKKIEYERRIRENSITSLHKLSSDTTVTVASPANTSKEETSSRVFKKRGRGNRAAKNGTGFIGFMGTNFPARLHDLLSHEEEISDIITWLPHGRSWIVRDKSEFLKKVAPSHFQISKFESFTRQVNGWGFKRITQGPDINSYYHEMFLRGMPHLIQWMKRSTSSGSGGRRRIRGDPKDEPDFYSISQMYPIPNYYSGHDGYQAGPESRHGLVKKCKNKDSHKKNKEEESILSSPTHTKKKLKCSPAKEEHVYQTQNNNILLDYLPSPLRVPLRNNKNYEEKSSVAEYDHSDHTAASPPGGGAPITCTHHDQYLTEQSSSNKNNDVVNQVKDFWTHGYHDGDHYNDAHTASATAADVRSVLLSNCSPIKNKHDETLRGSPKYSPPDDFKPAEGTIGDPEAFCWDDTDYGREHRHEMHGCDDTWSPCKIDHNSCTGGATTNSSMMQNSAQPFCAAVLPTEAYDAIHSCFVRQEGDDDATADRRVCGEKEEKAQRTNPPAVSDPGAKYEKASGNEVLNAVLLPAELTSWAIL